ncbi:hypothetical protein PQS90_09060 [Pseudomonas sp. BLCC-B13]|uniref:hypothetical protein n=1 Tax=Pseudomonas sp. BLCC-B13 TaxID=3025314 RepID=UPI00234F2785|nr:hypothetical protein [Pseudomonas sp. BLCC-B13]MDC7825298.1 hypothetical protein [Pseudomonas sp. BLCC-B13]
MNMLTMARESILELAQTLQLAHQARAAFEARRAAPAQQPYRTQVVDTGRGMVRVVELGTGRVLGFRRTLREAQWLASQLERDNRQQGAA